MKTQQPATSLGLSLDSSGLSFGELAAPERTACLPDASVGGHSFSAYCSSRRCAVTVASGARLTPMPSCAGAHFRYQRRATTSRPARAVARLDYDFHCEVPAQVEATDGYRLATWPTERSVAAQHALWSETAPDDDDAPPALPNVARASLLENIAGFRPVFRGSVLDAVDGVVLQGCLMILLLQRPGGGLHVGSRRVGSACGDTQ